MPSEKAMAKAAKVIKAPVNEKSAEKVADSDEETSSEGTSSSGSDDDATSSSGSDSGSGGESSSEEEDLPAQISKPTPSKPTATPKKIVPATKSVAAAPAPFQPPHGFEPLRTSSEPKASKILSNSKLQGKQIWYITAPANVPITSIKSVSLRDVQKGKAVAEINGLKYGFQKDEGPEKDNTKLLVPSREGEQYVPSKRNIDQVLHLQQIVQLPELMTKEKATVPAPAKFVRQQPKGLKMRFKPIGFGDEPTGKIGESEDEDSDVEMGDAPRAFKKHKVTEVSDDEAAPRKSKKDKEKKKDKKEKKSKV